MTSSLEGKVAIVTGAGRNIGRQICLTLADRGCDVGVVVRSNLDEAVDVVNEVTARGCRAVALAADVGDPGAVIRMVKRVHAQFGRVDVLVNNAGYRHRGPFVELTNEDWERSVAVNITGPLIACRTVIPLMIAQGGGSIVNISGLVVFMGGSSHAAAARSAVVGLTRGLAREFGAHGIRANCVVPSAIETSRPSPRDPGYAAADLAQTPLRRLGTVVEVAETCAFLASDQSAYITGQTIHVNGGRYMV